MKLRTIHVDGAQLPVHLLRRDLLREQQPRLELLVTLQPSTLLGVDSEVRKAAFEAFVTGLQQAKRLLRRCRLRFRADAHPRTHRKASG